MNRDLQDYRESYEKGALLLDNTTENPIAQFSQWFKEVEEEGGVREPNAMTISTLGVDGFPKGRIVLLKSFDESGFVFYTNYKSEKGESIAHHPNVSLSFFWPNLERQVIIKGNCSKLSPEKSDAYFQSRPKESQLGAVVSSQSSIIEDRGVLESEMKRLTEVYKNKEIPRPSYWGGILVKPETVEFWQGRPSRLHDRILYTKINENWQKNRLAP